MDDCHASSGTNPRFSYSITGGSKKNVVVDEMLHSQHNRNLKIWQRLVDGKMDSKVGSEVYYNKELDAVVVASQFTYTQDEKDLFDWRDHLWVTLISRPRFHLAPFCRIERK